MRHVVHCGDAKFAVAIKCKNAEISFAKTRTIRQDGLKYWVQFAG
jgi:hypothetical protein